MEIISPYKPEDVRFWLTEYGDKNFFMKKAEQGYTRVEFGRGGWFDWALNPEGYYRFIESNRINLEISQDGIPILNGHDKIRIVASWAFFGNPEGQVETLEHLKIDSYGFHRRGPKVTFLYKSIKNYLDYLKDYKIEIYAGSEELAKVNKLWEQSAEGLIRTGEIEIQTRRRPNSDYHQTEK